MIWCINQIRNDAGPLHSLKTSFYDGASYDGLSIKASINIASYGMSTMFEKEKWDISKYPQNAPKNIAIPQIHHPQIGERKNGNFSLKFMLMKITPRGQVPQLLPALSPRKIWNRRKDNLALKSQCYGYDTVESAATKSTPAYSSDLHFSVL